MKIYAYLVFCFVLLISGCAEKPENESSGGTDAAIADAAPSEAPQSVKQGEQGDAQQIYDKMVEVYRSADTLRVSGTCKTAMKMQGMEMKHETPFQMTMQRPDDFLATWESGMTGFSNNGAAWSNDEGSFFFSGGMGQMYVKTASMDEALSMATGISQGAVNNIPGLFFELSLTLTPTELVYEGLEEVEGTKCHHLSGKIITGSRIELWISTEEHHLIKFWQDLAMDAEMMADAMATTGDLPALENPEHEKMQESIMESTREIMKSFKDIEGYYEHSYDTTEFDQELAEDAFVFADLPEGLEPSPSIYDALKNMNFEMPNLSETSKFKIGDAAIDFEIKTMKGETLKLSEMKGKVVLLDFWATWCAPCVAEIPKLIEIYEANGGEEFEIISISTSDERQEVERFLKKTPGMDWTHVLDSEQSITPLSDQYEVEYIPQTFLLDREGKIVAIGQRGGQLEKSIPKVIAGESLE